MSPDRSCKRCSVKRVNALSEAYCKAFDLGEEKALRGLKDLVRLAGQKGMPDGKSLIRPGLLEPELRAVCFNLSSFLEDSELAAHLPDFWAGQG